MIIYTWKDVTEFVLTKQAHQDVKVPKSMVPHPSSEGFASRTGDHVGQSADFGMALSDKKGIHIREFEEFFLIHWDHVDPSVDPFGHLLLDAPHWLVIGSIVGFLCIASALFYIDTRANIGKRVHPPQNCIQLHKSANTHSS